MSFIVQGLDTAGSDIVNFFGGFANTITGGITNVIDYIVNAIVGFVNAIEGFIGSVQHFGEQIYATLASFATSVANVFGSIVRVIDTGLGDFVGFMKNLPNEIINGAKFIYKEIQAGINDIKNIIIGGVDYFIQLIVGFANVIRDISLYAISWIRYEFNYVLYYIGKRARNLVGGFIFGLVIKDVKNMKPTGLGDLMQTLLFESFKYGFMDVTLQSLFSFFAVAQKIPKPTPPPIPIINGVKLL